MEEEKTREERKGDFYAKLTIVINPEAGERKYPLLCIVVGQEVPP